MLAEINRRNVMDDYLKKIMKNYKQPAWHNIDIVKIVAIGIAIGFIIGMIVGLGYGSQ